MPIRSGPPHSLLAVTLLLALGPGWGTEAQAADHNTREIALITATTAFVVAIPGDLLLSASSSSPGDHWGYHLIPVAGPVIGLDAARRIDCSQPSGEYCGVGKGAILAYESIFLLMEVTGAVALGYYLLTTDDPPTRATRTEDLHLASAPSLRLGLGQGSFTLAASWGW